MSKKSQSHGNAQRSAASQLPWSHTDRRLSLVAMEMSRCWDRGWWGHEFPLPAGSTQALVTCGPLHPTRGWGCHTSPRQPGCSSFPNQADPCPSLGNHFLGSGKEMPDNLQPLHLLGDGFVWLCNDHWSKCYLTSSSGTPWQNGCGYPYFTMGKLRCDMLKQLAQSLQGRYG